MRVEINPEGRAILCEYIFKPEDLVVGTKWASTGKTLVIIEEIENNEWVKYSWWIDNVKHYHEKDYFSFQCRYCLVLE